MTNQKTSTPVSGTGNAAASFVIVGLGACADGFDAFLKAVPSDGGVAYVLVYSACDVVTVERVVPHTQMPVIVAEHGMSVAPDHVYIIPPDRDMEIEQGVLRLCEPRGKWPIDRFFMSLAADQGRNAVAVILSGTGIDGVAGIAGIKGQGGIVLAQDPDEALYGEMPRSAIASGAVDHIAPVAQMSGIITGLGRSGAYALPDNREPATVHLSADLGAFLAGSGVATLFLNSDLEVVWANVSFYDLLATTDRGVIGKSLFALSKGQWNSPELRRHLGRVLPDDLPIEAFSLTVDVQGRGDINLVLNVRKFTSADAGALIFVAVNDVTDQKKVRQALLDREARLNATLNAVTDAVVMIDAAGIVTSYSPPSAEVLGYTQSEVMGRNVNMLMPKVHRDGHDGYISVYLKTGEAKIIGIGREVEARHKSGAKVPVHLTVSEVNIGGARQFMGVLRDLTEERETRKQLLQAQKMEAVGQLTGGIAHDFNNLLTVIIGNIELLELRPDDPNREVILTEALEAANLGAALVTKLLMMSKTQILAPEPLDIADIIAGIHPLLQRTLGQQIATGTQVDGDLDQVLADMGQIQNAILNLAINARDAMPEGGNLMIGVQNVTVDADGPDDKRADLMPGEYVVVSVADDGAGMAPDVLDRVFEPFFTTKPPGQGTGLGLPVMYRWARESGGDVTLDSVVGKGTVVRIYLPAIVDGQAVSPVTDAPELMSQVAHGEVVLLVEDDKRVRNLTRVRLEHLGYVVVEVGNGPDALERLQERDDINLMLTDIVMPGGVSGLELAQRVTALYPSLAVVLATGFAPKAKDQPYPVLRKPYSINTLSKVLRHVLDVSRKSG